MDIHTAILNSTNTLAEVQPCIGKLDYCSSAILGFAQNRSDENIEAFWLFELIYMKEIPCFRDVVAKETKKNVLKYSS